MSVLTVIFRCCLVLCVRIYISFSNVSRALNENAQFLPVNVLSLTLLRVWKVEGTFRVRKPPVLLGYTFDGLGTQTDAMVEASTERTDNMYLTMFVTIEPQLTTPEPFHEKVCTPTDCCIRSVWICCIPQLCAVRRIMWLSVLQSLATNLGVTKSSACIISASDFYVCYTNWKVSMFVVCD